MESECVCMHLTPFSKVSYYTCMCIIIIKSDIYSQISVDADLVDVDSLRVGVTSQAMHVTKLKFLDLPRYATTPPIIIGHASQWYRPPHELRVACL